MFIRGLYSENKPVEQDWGTSFKHIPLNVKAEVTVDSDGNEVTGYRYDCVEKVPVPVTIDNIVKTALEASFSAEDRNYVTANIFKQNDAKVQAYTKLAAEVNELCQKAEYKYVL